MKEWKRKKEELGHIIEKRRKTQEEKEMLEFELMKEQFHLKHLPDRKKMVSSEASIRLFFLIPLTVFVVVCIILLIYAFSEINNMEEGEFISQAVAFAALIGLIGLTLGGYAMFRMWKQEASNISKFVTFGSLLHNTDVDTFKEDEQKTLKRILSLQVKISDIEGDIDRLYEQQKELYIKLEQDENRLKNEGLFDMKEPQKKTYSYQINEYRLTKGQIEEELRTIDKEINQIKNHIRELNEKDDDFAWQQKCIDAKYKKWTSDAKWLFVFFICIVMLQKLVELFSDVLTTLVAGVGMTVTLIGIYRLVRQYEDMLVPSLIENESDLVSTYVFQNSIVSVKQKRVENSKELERYQERLIKEREKRRELQDM